MLEEVRISGLGVIDDAVLELSPGLTCVTGETGAGKTMVVQGLALLFGGRADGGRVRPGSARAVIEGRLVLPEDHPAVDRARDAGADLDDGALLLARTVGADGRSRAHVGGRSVPVGVLGELAETLLAVHGQSDQQRLLRPAQQRLALDRYAGDDVLALRDRFRADWARWRDVRATLGELRAAAAERSREAELLRLGVAEVEAVAPAAGEDAALREDVERLAHADDLRAAAETAREALTADDGPDALALVTAARRALESVADHDPALAALAAQLADAGHLLTETATELASYAASVDADPLRLATLQERLAALTALQRRHAVPTVDGVLAWAATAGDRLLELDGADDRIAALEAEDAALESSLGALAAELTAARTAAAARFGEAVTVELVDLAMPHAVVTAEVTQREDPDGLAVGSRRLHAAAEGRRGRAAPRAAPRCAGTPAPEGRLRRRAEPGDARGRGGLRRADPVPVMVFDEVDAGVGGRAAVEVGRRLARLARDHQVLVVTHLPQVAAFADAHLQVQKQDDGTVTRSGVVRLDGDARVTELSRMLAGLESGTARRHAEELLAAAQQSRAADRGAARGRT